MFIYFTTRIISSVVAFLYPGYASYKTLSQRPASEADLERWLMYWTVLGCIVGVEYVAEWLVSWIPLYFTMKTIFLLYLSLPQTQGSSYIYIRYLQPFFHYHEDDIDATLVRLKTRIYTFVQEKLQLLWNQIMGSLGQAAAADSTRQPEGGADAAQPPTMADPVSGPAQLLGGLWRTYGPSIVASGAALLRQTNQAAQPSATTSLFSGFAAAPPVQPQRPHMSGINRATTESLLERRRQLEAELASLQAIDDSASDSSPERMIPIQHGSSSYLPTSPAGSDADLRSRVAQYEEVEVPSDVEGYDLGGATHKSDSDANRPGAANRRTSWFGWGSPPVTPEKGGKAE